MSEDHFLHLPELYTDAQGKARWFDHEINLNEGSPLARLSNLRQGSGHQFRMSPVGFRSQPHCTPTPQWVFILSGIMEIGLPDGSVRRFNAGQGFYSNDILPANATFDGTHHGHWSRQVGDAPLVTVFIRAEKAN